MSGCNRPDTPQPGVADVAGAPNQTKGPKPLFESIGRSGSSGSTKTSSTSAAPPSGGAKPTDDATIPCLEMVDIAADSGIDFVYKTGARGESLMVETMGGGCGVLDIDNDGLWDLFICQGGDPSVADAASQPPPALYRNLGDGRFANVVAEGIGAGGLGYCQGLVVGDYDGDGFDDVYVTSVGKNRLLRNMGDGTFRDVTDEAGVGDTRWSSSAAFADLDGDGLLDLYVCNYVVYDPLNPLDCRNRDGEPRICHPREMAYFPNECFINQGDGTFTAEAAERGLDGPGSKSLGVAVADFTGDGLPDVYVANDTTANFLFVNQGDGKFKEKALAFGCAVNQEGMYEAGMGLAVGDYDNDGFSDIYCTHFHEESNTLYRNQGGRGFRDVTAMVGLHKPTLPRLGFGTVMQDLNADGACDIFVTNGHIENYPGNPIHAMRPQLFTFLGRSWRDCSDQGGEFFKRKLVGRGVAMVDPTGKGMPDVVVVHQDSPAALLTTPKIDGNWLNVSFIGDDGNRRGIGCRVTVTSGEKSWFQQLVGGGSYCSSHQPTLFFGLGKTSGPCRVAIVWPDGRRQTLEGVNMGQHLTVRQRDAA
jgi:hypothetical protein